MIGAWFTIVFTGRYPRGLFDYVEAVMAWHDRVAGYAALLVTDDYPPFALHPDGARGPEPGTDDVGAATRMTRTRQPAPGHQATSAHRTRCGAEVRQPTDARPPAPTYAGRAMKILIAYDGSPDAKAAVALAGHLFDRSTAVVLTVWDGFSQVVAGPGRHAVHL